MEIIVGKTAGFCFGVQNAVSKAKEVLGKEKACTLGELVHNHEVTKDLENHGLRIIENIDDLDDLNMSVIIRSHGETMTTYERAKEKNIKLIDLTCPKVLKIHEIVKEYSQKKYYIFLIGKNTHPETIATKSYCGDSYSVIEEIDDIENKLIEFKKSGLTDLLIISQTTYSLEKFEKIAQSVKNYFEKEENKNINNNNNINIVVKNTICAATKQRQEETIELSKQVDMMIIIGGKHSSNTLKLYEIASNNCKKSILIETYEELNKEMFLGISKVGIMAGASTPKESIDLVVEFLSKI